MGELERGDVEVVGGELDELSAVALADADKTRRRNVEILQDYAARPKTGKPITVRFRFLASPVELLGDEHGHVRAVRIENNAIVARDDGALVARGTGDVRGAPAPSSCSARSATRGQPVAGIPFDERRGLIRNEGGRVTDPDGTHQPRRVRVGLDQARPVRRDRDEQEGLPGHRRQDPRGRWPPAASTSRSPTTSTRSSRRMRRRR